MVMMPLAPSSHPLSLPTCAIKEVFRKGAPPSSLDAARPGGFFRRPFMGKKLYVGNLTYGVTDSDLQAMFEPHGTVQSAQVIMDRDTGRSKGFGFVEMSNSN